MKYLSIFLILFCTQDASAQLMSKKNAVTHADTIRGTYNKNRSWWNVTHYDLDFRPDYGTKTISGSNEITFQVLPEASFSSNSETKISQGEIIIEKPGDNQKLQLDLQAPMQLDSVIFKGQKLAFERMGQAYLISFPEKIRPEEKIAIKTYFHGKPREAVMPPWDGGLIWSTDDLGNPWVSVACQGLGASAWWPCKDHGLDEPDAGATISIVAPANMVAVSNGSLKNIFPGDNYNTYQWDVKSPINSYNVTMNIGKYNKFEDVYNGLKGPLRLEFWFLEQHAEQAKAHLLDETKEMLKIFEYWFGAYSFYEDGYKLIETPFLGMEHQSGIAYGNKFKKGYLGSDLSGSGWGKNWDYILVHESGHEWFGNNVSVKDVADMWIHEGFTTYSEVLFVESRYGKKAADEYAKGLRRNIQNDKPIIGEYNINREGSGDMYFKGVQIIHMYRRMLNNDSTFRRFLHEMNRQYGHKTTTTYEVEALMQSYMPNIDLKPFFDVYLRGTAIPLLQTRWSNIGLELRFFDVPKGFHMPVGFIVNNTPHYMTVSDRWTKTSIKAAGNERKVLPTPDFYVRM